MGKGKATSPAGHNLVWPTPPVVQRRSYAKIGGAVAGALLLLSVIGAVILYYTNGDAHSLMNHTWSQIQNGELSLKEGLLYIGLPVASVTLGLYAVFLFRQKHQERLLAEALKPERKEESKLKELWLTFKTLKPTKRQLVALTLALSVLTLTLSGGAILVYCKPAIGAWSLKALQNKFSILQSIAIVGSVSLGSTLITLFALYLLFKLAEYKKVRYDYLLMD